MNLELSMSVYAATAVYVGSKMLDRTQAQLALPG